MNFYKQAATAIDHLDTKQGSVKGSIAAAGLGDGANGKEGKRVLACMPYSLVSMLYISDLIAVLHICCSQWLLNRLNVRADPFLVFPLSKPFRSCGIDRTIIQSLSDSLKLLQVEKKTFPQKVPEGAPSSKNLLLVLLHDLLFSKDAKIQASDKWPPKMAIMRHATRLKAELVKLQIKKGLSTKEAFEMEGGNIAGTLRLTCPSELELTVSCSNDSSIRQVQQQCC
jgi:putative methyltransferase